MVFALAHWAADLQRSQAQGSARPDPTCLPSQAKDIHVLGLEALCGIEHEDGHIAVLDGSDGAQHTVELNVFFHLALFAQTSGVDEHKLHAEGVVTRVVGIAGCPSWPWWQGLSSYMSSETWISLHQG